MGQVSGQLIIVLAKTLAVPSLTVHTSIPLAPTTVIQHSPLSPMKSQA